MPLDGQNDSEARPAGEDRSDGDQLARSHACAGSGLVVAFARSLAVGDVFAVWSLLRGQALDGRPSSGVSGSTVGRFDVDVVVRTGVPRQEVAPRQRKTHRQRKNDEMPTCRSTHEVATRAVLGIHAPVSGSYSIQWELVSSERSRLIIQNRSMLVDVPQIRQLFTAGERKLIRAPVSHRIPKHLRGRQVRYIYEAVSRAGLSTSSASYLSLLSTLTLNQSVETTQRKAPIHL